MTAYNLRPNRDPLLKFWSQLPIELLWTIAILSRRRHPYNLRAKKKGII